MSPEARAFSSEVDTGSREENASKQESCAWRGGLVPAGGAKVETRGASQYYPDFIDGMNLSG
jgi:hypothetical protein